MVAMTIRTNITRLTKNMGQSVLSLSFNLGGILAGTLLVLYLNVFSLAPWALILFPGILSIRGAIGGLFSGRLSTALHVGTVKPSYTKNTENFYLLLSSVVTLTFASSVILGVAACLFGLFLWGATITDWIELLAVIISTMGFSTFFLSPITIGVSILSFRRGLDPDIIVYPVISTIADILVSICYILVLTSFFLLPQQVRYLIGFFDFVFMFIVLFILIRNFRRREFVKTIKEFFLTLLSVALIVNVTGLVLSKISQVIGNKPEIYVVYPALIDTVGDVGSIVGSTATTKLALGLIDSSFSSVKQHSYEIGGAWAASLVMFTLYSMISFLARGVNSSIHPLKFIAQLLTTNVLAVLLMVFIAYALAIFTYKRGWDPDNFVIPIESSLADGITTLSLLIALTAIA